MKRLLKISLDLSLLSFIPILSWFALGLLVNKSLINVFTLTYPIQFIWFMLKSIFSTGANISKVKDHNPNATLSGIVIGTFVGFIIFGFLLLNIDSYINFMNMNISTYKVFAIYSIIQLYIQLVFEFIINKLYYENKNTLANKYSLIFNLLNFIVLVVSALIFKNQIIIVTLTLISISIFTIIILIKEFKLFKLKFKLINFIKYDSVDLFDNLAFFIIFLFGLSTAIKFGKEYALALTFIALITDTQWDTFEAISVAAKIDISKNKFNYKKHVKHAYELLIILLSTTLIMFISLYSFYNLDLKITLIYLTFDIINFILFPIYIIKTCYLQLEYSAVKATTNKIAANIIRIFLSLLKTPYCTGIGQVVSSIYQYITTNIIFSKNYVVNKNGIIENKSIKKTIFN